MHAAPRLRALALVLPLLAFVTLSFVVPLATLLGKSAYQPEVSQVFPETMNVLAEWDGEGLPPEAAFAAIAGELTKALDERTLPRVSGAINRVQSGMRGVLNRTARRLARTDFAGTWRETLAGISGDWLQPRTWLAIREAGARFTLRHYLQALDLELKEDGSIGLRPDDSRVYTPLMWRTLLVSLGVTLLCLLIGYPIAYMVANSPPRRSRLLLLLVLVPFWTSLLVRTTAWIVLLQRQGVINGLLVGLGILPDDARLQMIYNMTGTFVAMTHVLLPFMVLPLYSVMRSIPSSHMPAAVSLGASPLEAFRRVYLPQTLPGIGAGSLLVFILAIGYYITPALVGGRTGELISSQIAYHVQTSLNWGLAAALSSILLVAVTVLYLIYSRVVGIERMRLG
ncbi:MAG: ABC transporter permease [Gammaproteobacteria bacterium]|nr:ABC transporter permease [Chromatiales bacterium]MYA30993.1 ABC transporter permease [Gammaproteobacteria bacterium]MYE49261.1 ABC transporter permease [Gammaproteobacteria bacterium]MYF66356.1 ABC transporter permease [Gammaproteobacteria bacterium]MYK38210.1 ABC transporter permease [Gammaproteobacteria bacterium]